MEEPPVPSRNVLVIGGRGSGALELLGALTAKRRLLKLPYQHRVKIEGEEGLVVQADLVLHHCADPLTYGEGEPKKADVVLLCYNAFDPASSGAYALDTWREKLKAIDAPKMVVATGMEECVGHFIKEEEKEETAEHPNIFSAESLAALCEAVSARAAYELSTKHTERVKELFSHALREAVAPSEGLADTTLDAVQAARRRLLRTLQARGIGVPPKPAKVEKKWERIVNKKGKVQYKNLQTGQKFSELPKFETEMDELRTAEMSRAEDDRLARLAALEEEQERQWQHQSSKLLEEQRELKAAVAELEKEYNSIREEQERNETRGDGLQSLSDCRAYREDVILKRVTEDIDHEQKMAALHEELLDLQAEEQEVAKQGIKQEIFDALAVENRRLHQHLRAALEESKAVRLGIKKTDAKTKKVKSQLDDSERDCIKAEQEIQRSRNRAGRLKEEVTAAQGEKDWLSSEMQLQRGTEAVIAQQLRDWKREGRVLRSMIQEIDDKIAHQETPIAKFLSEEKKRARMRGGPLLLDDEDVQNWKNRRHFAGEYRAPSDKTLMLRLHTEHDRMHLQFQFLCADVAERATQTDGVVTALRGGLADYTEVQRDVCAASERVAETYHRLLLLLEDLVCCRSRAARRLQRREDRAGSTLLRLQGEVDAFLEQCREGEVASGAGAFPLVEARVGRLRAEMYRKAEEAEELAEQRRAQVRALQAVAGEKQRVVQRLQQREDEAEEEERLAEQVVADLTCVVQAAGDALPAAAAAAAAATTTAAMPTAVGKERATFVAKALIGLHPDTQQTVLKRCAHRRPLTNIDSIANEGTAPHREKKGSSIPWTHITSGPPPARVSRQASSSVATAPETMMFATKASATRPGQRPASSATAKRSSVRGSTRSKASCEEVSAAGSRVHYDSLVNQMKREFGVTSGKHALQRESHDWKKIW